MSTISVAGLQLEAVNGNNVDTMEAEIDAAKKRFPWLDMIILGELNACGTDKAYAQSMPGPVEERFCRSARNRSARSLAARASVSSFPHSFLVGTGRLVALSSPAPASPPTGETTMTANRTNSLEAALFVEWLRSNMV